ncbi:MAG: hypothetical protein IPK85_02105 [Gemmatimonadetes bacterium]|nr:hypothetical protein [Gemmatimonadota bacterium]
MVRHAQWQLTMLPTWLQVIVFPEGKRYVVIPGEGGGCIICIPMRVRLLLRCCCKF